MAARLAVDVIRTEIEQANRHNQRAMDLLTQLSNKLDLLDTECSFCYESVSFREPLRAPCGHVYCAACVQTWLGGGNDTCPSCRRPNLRMQDLVPAIMNQTLAPTTQSNTSQVPAARTRTGIGPPTALPFMPRNVPGPTAQRMRSVSTPRHRGMNVDAWRPSGHPPSTFDQSSPAAAGAGRLIQLLARTETMIMLAERTTNETSIHVRRTLGGGAPQDAIDCTFRNTHIALAHRPPFLYLQGDPPSVLANSHQSKDF